MAAADLPERKAELASSGIASAETNWVGWVCMNYDTDAIK
jgi:predicted transcriptional regulator YheO